VGVGKVLGDRECGEPDTEMDSFDDKFDTELGEAAVVLEFGVAGEGITGYWGNCKEDGNPVEEDWKGGMETEEFDVKGNADSWKTTSKEINILPVGIW
jgi:hypothetical protein